MTDLLAYRQNGRGSGRTTRLIKAMPKGGYYVVHSAQMIPIVKRYLKQIGREGELEVVSISNPHWMRGPSNIIVGIDHFVFDSTSEQQVAEMYQGFLPCGSMVMTNDYEGDVMTTLHDFPRQYTPTVVDWDKVVITHRGTVDTPLVEPAVESKFKALFGRFWPL